MTRTLTLLSLAAILGSCSAKKEIVDIPILFDGQRIELTKQYMAERYGLPRESIRIDPRMIVIHWTAIPDLKKSFEAFNRPTLPSWRPDLVNVSGLNVSAHFLVDRDGTIYRLMPEITMARHTIGLNHCAIGVENVGGTEGLPLTRKQLRANVFLVRHLAKTYDIDYVIGHQQYTLFEDHPLWLEVDQGYRTVKTDPGLDFMEKVHRRTKNLNLKPLPAK